MDWASRLGDCLLWLLVRHCAHGCCRRAQDRCFSALRPLFRLTRPSWLTPRYDSQHQQLALLQRVEMRYQMLHVLRKSLTSLPATPKHWERMIGSGGREWENGIWCEVGSATQCNVDV